MSLIRIQREKTPSGHTLELQFFDDRVYCKCVDCGHGIEILFAKFCADCAPKFGSILVGQECRKVDDETCP